MVRRVAILYMLCLCSCAMEEFEALFHMVQSRLPDHYMCPRGPVGVAGPLGAPGKTEELTEVAVVDYECDLEVAADQVLERLSTHIPLDSRAQPGPPGPVGLAGLSSNEYARRLVMNVCYAKRFNCTTECRTTWHVYHSLLRSLQNPLHCPPMLEGVMGPRGWRGVPGNGPKLDPSLIQCHKK